MNAIVKKEKKAAAHGAAFSVRQMLAALNLGSSDEAVLRYLDFFTAAVPVKATRILHVIPRFEWFQGLEPVAAVVPNAFGFRKGVLEEVESRVQVHPIYKQSKVSSDVREGNLLEHVLGEAEALEADLIVVGQKREAADRGILAGNLIRKALANVLIVPEDAPAQISHIVVPVDFSPYSVKALESAIALRRTLGPSVRITCVNVYELPNLNIYLVEKIEDVRRMVVDDRKAAFRDFLKHYAGAEESVIETAFVERQSSSIASCIYGYVRQQGANLLVMGAKGHSQVERLLLGSVSESLLKIDGDVPMLVVR
jgi:nucleotide-binding universal stress UspA family protein